MSATNNKEKFRKPRPILWTATSLIIMYMVWCIVVPILTTTGHLYSIQSPECLNNTEFESRRHYEQKIVCLWSSLNLALCIILLLKVWIKRFVHVCVFLIIVGVIMICTFDTIQKNEIQGMENLKKHYLALLTHNNTENMLMDKNCDIFTNMYHWQTKFKCCGLESYQDWNSVIPDSCLCEGEDNKSGCVGAGDTLVYEKPCFPIVVSLAEKQRSTFQMIVTVWVVIIGVPFAIFLFIGIILLICVILRMNSSHCRYVLKRWKDKICANKKVPVVFIRKNNNNQTAEEKVEEQHTIMYPHDACVDITQCPPSDNPVIMIPLSLLRRLQEELDPPPVQHKVQNEKCHCIFPPSPRIRPFYTVLVDDDSPLLPGNAVVVDAHKPTQECYWSEGHRAFEVREIVWPQVKMQDTTEPNNG
ncbi:uncharacterized protein LOC114429874 [Parambassis ranga]|uniref:Uncharacterized protein LOC114429874 n=1 Tax=Parambassis ranga TaxID=210632 RepID=A0A6P7HFG7_9TELE|nr:uncharacterized protein LOC114429874 [Parambassis ranga]